jgi:hypothetical protein
MGKEKKIINKTFNKFNSQLLKEDKYSDITIEFHNEEKLKLHKNILYLNSAFFEEKFSNENDISNLKIEENDIELFKKYIEYLYTLKFTVKEEKYFDFLDILFKVKKLLIIIKIV